MSDQLCATASRCCPIAGHGAPEDCPGRARVQLHAARDREIKAGAVFDPAAAQDCLAAYRDIGSSCPATLKTPAPCRRVLTGTALPGEPCDLGCAPSSEGTVVCAFTITLSSETGHSTSPKFCQVEQDVPPGEACDEDVSKPVVRVCDTTGGSWCFAGTCSTPVSPGGACTGNDCSSGTICRDGTCQLAAAIGEMCTDTSCVPGASCDPSTMTCREIDSWKSLCIGEFE